MKTFRAALVAAVLALSLVASIGASAASAHPSHVTYRTTPSGMKVKYVDGVPSFSTCTRTYHVYLDAVVFRNVGDDSLTVGVTQQWYEDSAGNYCGRLAGRTNVISNDCWPRNTAHENVVYVVDEIFRSDGLYLGGWGNVTDLTLSCNSMVVAWGNDSGGPYDNRVDVPCGTTIHTWATWTEKYGAGPWPAESNGDGEDVGNYGNLHTICVN
jgi:hypothetical protein